MGESWEIIFYRPPNQSNSPVQDFIETLERRTKSKIGHLLELLESYGTTLGSPYSKKLTGTPLWELRIIGGENIRILYVALVGKNFLLLHAFNKKKQKTDKKEINTAKLRLKEYSSRIK